MRIRLLGAIGLRAGMSAAVLLVGFGFVTMAGTVHAQTSTGGLGGMQSPTGTTTRNSRLPDTSSPDADADPAAAQHAEQRARAVNDDRQKHIVDETAKLVQLANELKADVEKSNKNEMSMDVIRKADEIERLAHDVKQRMKGQ